MSTRHCYAGVAPRRRYGGGSVLSPIDIYLAGRATTGIRGEDMRIEEIAIEGSRSWIQANFHALDAERHVRYHALVQPGSQDLQALFARRPSIPLANDTSIGAGYAPLSALEQLVLGVERQMNARDRISDHPAWGEDVKVMGVRCGSAVRLTVACAMIGGHVAHIDDYLAEKAAVGAMAQELAVQWGFPTFDVSVNAADDPTTSSLYLTVTGTSAEAGDDGQVGRGNRVNGLITPCRPMSLEAAAGKNPVTHVGKIYNVVAREIAETVVSVVPEIGAAQCLMVSRIGRPVTSPAIMQVKIAMRDGLPIDGVKRRVEEVVTDRLAGIPQRINDFVAGWIDLF